MKKSIFKLTAFFLILCFLVPIIHKEEVFADSAAIEAFFNRRLVNIPNSSSPIYRQEDTGADEVFLSWKLVNGNGGALGTGSYMLEYFIDDETKVEFIIHKRGDSIEVSYDVWKWNAGDSDYTTLADPFGYEVYAAQVASFAKIDDFFDKGYNSDIDDYQVLPQNVGESTDAPYNKLRPHFTIMSDTGFSFKYLSGTIIHFRWDAASNSLYFQTNGVMPGRIYDFKLSYKDKDSDPWPTIIAPAVTSPRIKTVKIMPGISPSTFRSIPIANDNVTDLHAPLDLDQWLIDDTSGKIPAFVSRILNMDHESSLPLDDSPGSPDNILALCFDIPMGYNDDPTELKFNNVPDNIVMPVTISLRSSEQTSLSIEIDDIYKPDKIKLTGGIGTLVGKPYLYKGPNNEPRIAVFIGKLNPSMYFSSADIDIKETSNAIRFRNSKIGERTVFTFPYFEFRELDSKLYAVVTPYNFPLGGYYMLRENGRTTVTIKYNNETEVWLPLSVSPGGPAQNYQVFFSPITEFINNNTDTALYSQTVDFRPQPSNFMGSPPNNFRIYYNSSNKFILAPIDPAGEKAELLFNAQWDLGNKNAIDAKLHDLGSLTLEYKLYRSTSPNNPTVRDPDDLFETILVKITQDPDDPTNGPLHVTYTRPDGTRGKILEPDTTEPQLLKTRPDPPTGTQSDVYIASVPFKANAARKQEAGIDFVYPDIYFLNVEMTKFNSDSVRFTSLYDNITLNDFTNQQVPPPGSLTLADAVTTGENASFHVKYSIPTGKIAEYMLNTSLSPETDMTEIYANLYISQDEKFMTDTFSQFDKAVVTDASGAPVDIFHKEESGENYVLITREDASSADVSASGPTIYFSKQEGSPDITSSDPRTALREGKMVKIADIPYISSGSSAFDLTFAGLDKNQKYYVYADLYVRQTGTKPTNPDFKQEKASILSNLVAITTAGNLEIPGEEEKVPQTPMVTASLTEDGVAHVEWPKILPATSSETIEYEIIRLQGQRITDANLNRRDSFESFFNNYLPSVEKLGWRTRGDTGLEVYTPPWQDAIQDYQEYSALDDPNALTDYSLLPNQLYYYYVRTVRILSDGTRVPSLWNGDSVTTPPVKNPTNLKIENNLTNYDKKTQVTISFDAPLPSLDELGSIYQLWYQLKEDGGDWAEPVRMDVSALKSRATASTSGTFHHFLYTISGLKPNTGYSVRVRMTDQNNEPSLYSNIATFRTDMDQGEYDIEKEEEEWNDFLDKELQKLIKDPYWVSRDTSYELEVVYRPTMFNGLLSQSTDASLTLVSREADRAVYYLPASAILSANDANKGFRIVNGDMEIVLSANALLGTNDTLIQIADRIKSGALSDYFIRVTVIWTTLYDRVEGNEALSKQAEVRIEAIGSTQNIKSWDDDILAAIRKQIADKLEDSVDGLADKLASTTTSEARVQYVENIVNKEKLDIISSINNRLNTILSYSYAVTRLDAPLIIIAKGIDPTASVSAYERQSGIWVSKDVTPFGGSHAIYTTAPGIFVFTGRVIVIPGIDTVQDGGNITAIVGKYGLDDYFGKDGAFSLEANATGYMVAGSVARMSGAPKGADPYAWLRENKGVTLSTRNMHGNMQTQEAVFLVMNLYETKTGTKLSTIQIRNYNLTANLAGLDNKYKQSVRAAFEVGIYTNTAMQPKNPIKIKEFLQMLNTLDAKSKL